MDLTVLLVLTCCLLEHREITYHMLVFAGKVSMTTASPLTALTTCLCCTCPRRLLSRTPARPSITSRCWNGLFNPLSSLSQWSGYAFEVLDVNNLT